MVVEPGHFHATLLQKEMYVDLSPRVAVYARLGPDLLDYLNRISLFNTRSDKPTRWELDIHTSSDPMRAMLEQKPGNVVVITGRNRGKIDRILAALSARLNVLADKPWIISPSEMGKLEEALETAGRHGVVGYDIMTERYEVTSQLQRALVNSPGVFGRLEGGSDADPGIRARSVHHVMKTVAGVPLRRPAWFFDTAEYGEGLADVGTHVIDLVQWTAFPEQAIDYREDIRMTGGRRWPLEIDSERFRQVTGEAAFPAALQENVAGGVLRYYCNNSVSYVLRGVHVKLDILWNWQAAEGGDVYEATFRGSKARVEIRQGKAEAFQPEVYVVPIGEGRAAEVFSAVQHKVDEWQARWPGLAASSSGREVRLVIPEKYRLGHEAHFAEVSQRFLEYLKAPKTVPAWERPNMLARYYVSTRGVELGQANRR
jgi:predicted dehydrogenase